MNESVGLEKPISKVPMTPKLERLLNPNLNSSGEPIFTAPIRPPREGEKVYDLSPEEINKIRALRGQVVDLHPGNAGVDPRVIIDQIEKGIKLTSLDYMLTQGCNFECTWCFAESGPLQTKFIPFNILEKTTQEAADLGVSLFILTGGEPLIYKDPALGKEKTRGDHFFRVVDMIKNTYEGKDFQYTFIPELFGIEKDAPKILTFDDVALITPEIAERFAERGVGLCTKGDTLIPELQDFKVNQVGGFERMQRGYENLINARYGSNPNLRLVVNSVLDQTTFDGMLDLHMWVKDNGFDHSIVPVHYCGNAVGENQELGIHSPHVRALYDIISRIDGEYFEIDWDVWSAFSDNKTCNRNRSGLHIRANGNITACSESPGPDETDRYVFGNVFDKGFSLTRIVDGKKLNDYRDKFLSGHGKYVCGPDVCDLNANDLCSGGCATRSAYSQIDYNTGLIIPNLNPHSYSEYREDPLCPAWTVLSSQQGVLREGLLEEIHDRLIAGVQDPRVTAQAFPYREI
jgi:radical SAM protein with 4Fe4S-binding SPASM domain|tara:strand:- start:21577 stop:23127 length:1551 start_codon:yes stop_codon:yes gene_type:complete